MLSVSQTDSQQHTCLLQLLVIYADYYVFETTQKEQADDEETVGEWQHAKLARTCSYELRTISAHAPRVPKYEQPQCVVCAAACPSRNDG